MSGITLERLAELRAMHDDFEHSNAGGTALIARLVAAVPELLDEVERLRSPALPSTAQVTEYRLSLLPEDDFDRQVFELTVSWRGRGLWAVTRFGLCLGADGAWDYEPSPSNREDDWLATHRFELGEALRRADEVLPTIRVMGKTAADVPAERGPEDGGAPA